MMNPSWPAVYGPSGPFRSPPPRIPIGTTWDLYFVAIEAVPAREGVRLDRLVQRDGTTVAALDLRRAPAPTRSVGPRELLVEYAVHFHYAEVRARITRVE